ncbi:substrate-binding periplasmic protein [Shewanella sp. HL-SH2]|uniref:substrate-binding periplasmic protein n=1 Tax=Shewanella sp. HL-SH2 TaxID=3436238 RepID=UPI003EB8F28F
MLMLSNGIRNQHLYIFLSLFISSAGVSDTLELSTLDWPPFSGAELTEKGIATRIVKHAIAYDNHQLKVTVVPWVRAIRMVKTGAKIGYFPEYINVTNEFIFSQSLGASPIGLLELKNNPIVWDTFTDLNKYVLGVVKGYVNTDEIDTMIANGEQKYEEAMNEKQNILKLAAGRIDTIVIDLNVYQYLKSDPKIEKISHLLQINNKILDSKSLHVALANNKEGERWLKIINDGLSKFEPQIMLDAYLQEINKHP